MDTLRAIGLFAASAEAGSFQRVAVAEGITPQAVSKAVRQLERHLGVRLLHRTTRRSSLTSDGRAFLESVRPALAAIDGAVGRARAATEAIEGPLRITAPRFLRRLLAAPLSEFAALHPQVQVELRLDDAFTDLVAEQIDVGLRAGPAPTGQVVTRPLFTVQQRLAASPSYVARHGLPRTLAELAQHRCTGFRFASTGRLAPWPLRVDGALHNLEVPPAYGANDAEAELDAVLAGAGIGLIDSVSGAEHLRAGRLVPVLPAHPGADVALHLYYAERRALPRRVRAFIDFAVDRLRNGAAWRYDATP